MDNIDKLLTAFLSGVLLRIQQQAKTGVWGDFLDLSEKEIEDRSKMMVDLFFQTTAVIDLPEDESDDEVDII